VKKDNFIVLAILAMVALGCMGNCKPDKETGFNFNSLTTNTNSNGKAANTGNKKMPETTSSDSNSGFAISDTAPSGKDIAAPASGTASVWGTVKFNSKPSEKIEVKLCETLNSFNMQCGGKNFKTTTNADGEFLITNVPAKEYGGLIVKVFNTNFYVFEAGLAGIPKKYKIEADKIFYVNQTNLFKGDLKILNPKNNSKSPAENLELKWQDYEGATYYKLNLTWSGKEYKASPYVAEKVEGSSLIVDKPLDDGEYWLSVDAYNADDIKIATSPTPHKIKITGGAAAAPSKQ
jgi:hypothetical protein